MDDFFEKFKSDVPAQDIALVDFQEQLHDMLNAEAEERSSSEVEEQKEGGIFKEFGFDLADFLKNPFSDSKGKIHDSNLAQLRDEEYKEILFDWSDVGLANCLAFASGYTKNPITGGLFDHKPAPGDISGQLNGDYMPYFDDLVTEQDEDGVRETLETYWRKDCEACGKELIPMESGDYQPKEGERLIAMMYSDQPFLEDFHFMVKGQYDTWYHKPGVLAPKRTDESGNIIYDPATCDRGIYNHFCGYYLLRDKMK